MTTSSPLQEIICCMGLPVSGNPSQFVLERAATAAKLDIRCLTVDVDSDRLSDAIAGAAAMGFLGIILADAISRDAFRLLGNDQQASPSLGAVDVIYRTNGEFVGVHSVALALEKWFQEAESPPTSALILGSDTSAQAAACAVAAHCSKIRLATTADDRDSWETLCAQLSSDSVEASLLPTSAGADVRAASENSLVIDATTNPAARPRGFDRFDLPDSAVIIELNFDPQASPPDADASVPHPTTVDGLEMLVLRYDASFEVLTGVAADRALIRESLEEFFLI